MTALWVLGTVLLLAAVVLVVVVIVCEVGREQPVDPGICEWQERRELLRRTTAPEAHRR